LLQKVNGELQESKREEIKASRDQSLLELPSILQYFLDNKNSF